MTSTVYTATSLYEGFTYSFKVHARNDEGYGEFSEVTQIIAAIAPDKPYAPITIWLNDIVQAAWYEPNDNGAEITSYTITFREVDLEFSANTVNCDGSLSSVVASRTCYLPVSVFKAEPYSLPWGDGVYAKVVATNAKGDSETSDEGNGCIIIYNPDPPVDVREDTQYRSVDTLGI